MTPNNITIAYATIASIPHYGLLLLLLLFNVIIIIIIIIIMIQNYYSNF